MHVAGSESEIVQRNLAEKALQEKEKEFKRILDATPAMIAYLDGDFRYLRVNAAYEKRLGATVEHILGRHVEEVIGRKAWSAVSHYFKKARSGEQVRFDRKLSFGIGPARWIHAIYTPNADADGSFKGIVVYEFDIEERVLFEQKITLLNQRLQRRIQEMQVIFNTVPIGLCIAETAKGGPIRRNKAAERMLGYAELCKQAPASEFASAITVMHRGLELAAENFPLQRAVRGEYVGNLMLEIIRRDGQAVTVLCNASPLFNESGRPRGAVGAFLDISPLIRVEKSLENSQIQLRLFVEQASLSIAMLDLEMNYLVASNRWIKEFGRGFDRLGGLNYFLVNPDLPKAWKRLYHRALSGEAVTNDDELWVHADGRRQWLHWSAYPWMSPSGEIGGIIVFCEDVTARRLAEQELRSSEARLALVIDQVKAGYWDWDLTARKLFLSPEAKRQIGFDNGDIPCGRDEWSRYLHPDDRAVVLEMAEDYIAGRRSNYEAEFRLLHKDGGYRWFHCRSVLLSDNRKRPCRMLGINLDITEYMKQTEIRERRGKIEQSFRVYVAMQTAAAFAHELNQPLSAISSYADVALHMVQTENPNKQNLCRVLENCSFQAQRAGETIRELLALLQREEITGMPMDINIAVREAVDVVEADGIPTGIAIEIVLADGLPPVKANSLQIQKVLVNLLRNGLESVLEQASAMGMVTITTERAAFDSAMVLVMVRDNGKGVQDADDLKKIFKTFYTTKPSGLGMGLAISRSLILAHGGKMWAEQNAGNGITIHFTLPFDA